MREETFFQDMKNKKNVENENRRILYVMLLRSFGSEKIFLKQMRHHNAYSSFDHIIELMNEQILNGKATYDDVVTDPTIGRLIVDLMYDLHKK